MPARTKLIAGAAARFAVAVLMVSCSGGGGPPAVGPTPVEAATTDTTEPPATTAPSDTAPPGATSPTTAPALSEASSPPGTSAPAATLRPAGAEGLGDSFYPFLGNGGYDVLHYRIDLNVDPEANEISALVGITASATEDLEEFNLDLSGMDVLAVVVAGVGGSDPVDAEFTRAGHELAVQPGRLLTEGTVFTTSVLYTGWPEPLDDPGVPFFEVGWHQQGDIIYTASQPSGSMTWFPSNNHPADKATFEIRVTVPEGLVAASNGLLASETTSGGKTTFEWRMDDPMATYLAAVYIGDFERIDHGPLREGGPLLRDYVPSGAQPEVAEALAVTAEALAFLEELLGPYPFDAYGTVVVPFGLGFALENQTLSLHGNDILDPGTIAHEAAHQWFGNSVALDDWSEIWLNEGFATYLHVMFEAHHYGYGLDAAAADIHSWLVAEEMGPPKGIEVPELFDATVYFRGAMTLHALRLHAGDEVFFDIMRTHYERSAGGTTNTAEFLALVDEMAGAAAVELVESWLHDETVPDTL